MKKINVLFAMVIATVLFSGCASMVRVNLPQEEVLKDEQVETESEEVETESSESVEEEIEEEYVIQEFYGTNPYIMGTTSHITDDGYLINTHPYNGKMNVGGKELYKSGFLYFVKEEDAMEVKKGNLPMFDTIYELNDVSDSRRATLGFVTCEGVTYYGAGNTVAILSDDLQSHTALFKIDEDLTINGMCMVGDKFYISANEFSGKYYFMCYSMDGEKIASVEGEEISNIQYVDGYFYYKLIDEDGYILLCKNTVDLDKQENVKDEILNSDDNGLSTNKKFFICGDMVYLHNETAETITGHKIGENGSSVIAQKAEFAVFHNGKFYTVEYSGGNYRNYFITEVDPLTNETRSIGSYSSSSHIENQYDIDVAGDYIFMRQPGGFTNVHKISTGERSGYPILP